MSVLGLLLCFRSVGLVLFEREGLLLCFRSLVFETEREGLLLCFRSLVFETERGGLLLCFRSVGVVLFETEREGLLCFRSVGLVLFETEREGLLLCFRSPCHTSGWRETCQSVQSALSVIKRVAVFSDYRTTAVSGAEPW